MSSYISCLIKLFFKLLDIFNNKKYYTNKTYLTLSKRFFFRSKLQKVFQYIYTVYGRRHSKLFTNCHVSWGVMYFSTYTYPPYSTSDLRQIRYATHLTYIARGICSCCMDLWPQRPAPQPVLAAALGPLASKPQRSAQKLC